MMFSVECVICDSGQFLASVLKYSCVRLLIYQKFMTSDNSTTLFRGVISNKLWFMFS